MAVEKVSEKKQKIGRDLENEECINHISKFQKKRKFKLLCRQFAEGARAMGHEVNLVRLAEKKIGFCLACDGCMRNGGICVQKDNMAELLVQFQKADVLVLATPVYFYGITAQMKTFIDRTYPIWRNLGKKEVYYIVSAGLGEDIIERSLGDLDGFVEHLEDSPVKGRTLCCQCDGCREDSRNFGYGRCVPDGKGIIGKIMFAKGDLS